MDFLYYKSQRLHPFFQVIGVERGMGRGVGGCGSWDGERGDAGLRKMTKTMRSAEHFPPLHLSGGYSALSVLTL